MKAYTYIEKGRFELKDKPEPRILDSKDAIVKVTLASICTSDLHIKHGYVNNCQSPDGGWALGCRDRRRTGRIRPRPVCRPGAQQSLC